MAAERSDRNSFQLPDSEVKAEYVLRQFDRIAARYDLTNDAISMGMHRLWKLAAVQKLCDGASQGSKYLDVCCGTGDLSLMIAEKLSTVPDTKVLGLDFSSNMLAVAARRSAKAMPEIADARRLEWRQGDAQNLPSEDNAFDGAIISFGLRNLTDLQRGLNEMARVVKPGGKIINLDLGRSEVPVFASLFRFYFRNIVPIIGDILQNDRQAYTYLPESLNTYPTPERISHMFETAGLKDVEHIPLALGSVAMHVGIKPSAL